MSNKEFTIWAAALQTYYPRFNLLPNKQAMSLWFDALKDLPAEVLTAALKKWTVTEKWPPTIAELREKCDEIVNGDRPDWGSAWGEVQRAIRRWGYMQIEEAMNSMSPVTREAVRRIGWQNICESENPEAIRAQFRQIYELCDRHESTERGLPPELKVMIQSLRIGQGPRPELEGEKP